MGNILDFKVFSSNGKTFLAAGGSEDQVDVFEANFDGSTFDLTHATSLKGVSYKDITQLTFAEDDNGDLLLINSSISAGVTVTGMEVVCFAAGTEISTPSGPILVETLSVGDWVFTKDRGPQKIRWVGRKAVSRAALQSNPNLRPIRIEAGALGLGVPERDLTVSPQHRILVRSKIAMRMFNCDEVLIAAKQLTGIDGIYVVGESEDVFYVHFSFDQHEIVFANGAETESLYCGEQALKALAPAARRELFELFPELARGNYSMPLVRHSPKGRRSRKLASRHMANSQVLVS